MKLHNVTACPKCGSEVLSIYDTRKKNNVVWRRRKCVMCGEKFATVEILSDDLETLRRQSNIIKKMLMMTEQALKLSEDETLDI